MLYLGTCDFRSYTLTVVAHSEKKAWDALKDAYKKAIASRNAHAMDKGDKYPSDAWEYFEYVGANVQAMTPGRVEWL